MLLKKYLNLKIKKNIFKKEWHKIEKTGARHQITLGQIPRYYLEFISIVLKLDDVFVKKDDIAIAWGFVSFKKSNR